MDYFKGNLLFREEPSEKIYDCREDCELALYRDTSAEETKQWIKSLCENGYEVIRKNKILSLIHI